MPRDRNAALNAWAKRKRAQSEAPGGSTAAAVAAMGVGSTTRAALVDAHGRVKAMKEKLAAKPAGPKPVAGPMAGKGTATRAAIGQKAAAKRRENKKKQELADKEANLRFVAEGGAARLFKDPAVARQKAQAAQAELNRMKGNAAASENAHPAKADPIDRSKVGGPSGRAGDLFGHNKDADATPGGDAFNKAFEKQNDAYFERHDPSSAVKVKQAVEVNGAVNDRYVLTMADGTKFNVKPTHRLDKNGKVLEPAERLDIHRGENDFPPPPERASLAAREAATHYVDQLIGLNATAPAKMFDNVEVQGVKIGKGVMLGWKAGVTIPDMQEQHIPKPRPDNINVESVSKIQILDAVIGAQDRHGANFVWDIKKGKGATIISPIDHGYTMGHDRNKNSWGGNGPGQGTGKGKPDHGGRRMAAYFTKVDKMDEATRHATIDRLSKIQWKSVEPFMQKKFGLTASETNALRRRTERVRTLLSTNPDAIMRGEVLTSGTGGPKNAVPLDRRTGANAARP